LRLISGISEAFIISINVLFDRTEGAAHIKVLGRNTK